MMDRVEQSLSYFAGQQRSRQWEDFLQALGDELSEQMSDDDIQSLMYVLGRRIGAKEQPASADTLEGTQDAANQIWERMNWGWASFRDLKTSLEITHHCAPFTATFGERGTAWGAALLEGVYSRWLEAFGAGEDLLLRHVESERDGVELHRFRLGHRSLFG